MVNLKLLYDEETIQKRIQEMAEEIDRDYEGKSILAICVLRGAIYFAVDLTKKMKNTSIEIDFVRVSSYSGIETTGKIDLTLDVSEDLKDRDVLIIEDIIDTGYTLSFLKKHILEKNPRSLKVAVLADKEERRRVPVDVDYVGFKIPSKYIVGYGFDYNNTCRNLNYIGTLEN